MRYFDIATHTETHMSSSTTIPYTDTRVKEFFKPLKAGYRIIFVNDLPVIELVPSPTIEELLEIEIARTNALVYDELARIDRESIRDIREWIAAQPSAPQRLKDREALSVAHRATLR